MRERLRFRVTLWFALVLTAVVALSFMIVYVVSRSAIQRSVRDVLIQNVEMDVDEVSFAPRHLDGTREGDAAEIQRYLEVEGGHIYIEEDFIAWVNDVHVALYDEDGQLLYGQNPVARACMGLAAANREVQVVQTGDESWYVYDRTLEGGGLEGLYLRGTVSQEKGAPEHQGILELVLLAMVVLLVVGICGGYIIARRALAPIERVSRAAQQIERDGDLKRRIALGAGSDEAHELANSFDAMVGRLESSFEAQRRFTSDASHELRTPLAVILAQCEYTLEEDRDADEYREALLTIRRQGSNMSHLVEDLLEVSRVEQGLAYYRLAPLDLSMLVSGVCLDAKMTAARDISLTTNVDPQIMVCGNDRLLIRMVDNLVSNAYAYGREGGWIMVSLTTDEGDAVLTVEDNGCGISADDVPHVFERFFRADRMRSSEGTGIGLALVAEIAQFHAGSVRLRSEVDRGSTFEVRLPLVKGGAV